jgi:hypothetical protein
LLVEAIDKKEGVDEALKRAKELLKKMSLKESARWKKYLALFHPEKDEK